MLLLTVRIELSLREEEERGRQPTAATTDDDEGFVACSFLHFDGERTSVTVNVSPGFQDSPKTGRLGGSAQKLTGGPVRFSWFAF